MWGEFQKAAEQYIFKLKLDLKDRLVGPGSSSDRFTSTAAFCLGNPLALGLGIHQLLRNEYVPDGKGDLVTVQTPMAETPFCTLFGSAELSPQYLGDLMKILNSSGYVSPELFNKYRKATNLGDEAAYIGVTFANPTEEDIERVNPARVANTGHELAPITPESFRFAPYGYASLIPTANRQRIVRFYGSRDVPDLVTPDGAEIDVNLARTRVNQATNMGEYSLIPYRQVHTSENFPSSDPKPFMGSISVVNRLLAMKDVRNYAPDTIFAAVRQTLTE